MSNQSNNAFGRMVYNRRHELNLSMEALAARAGLDHSAISRVEGGSRTPSRPTVEALVKALRCDSAMADNFRMAAGYMPRRLDALNHDPELTELAYALDAARQSAPIAYGYAIGALRLLTKALLERESER